MASKQKRDAEWAKAKRVCRLNRETIRMAKELRMNPRKLIKNIPSKSQPWKAPVHIWIRDLYDAKMEKVDRKRGKKQAQRIQPQAFATQQDILASRDPFESDAIPF